MKRRNKILLTIGLVIAVLIGGVGFYISDYYHADENAMESVSNPNDGVTVYQIDHKIVFKPDTPRAGFVFYPGGKVEVEAYAPLMESCAEKGILCVLAEMPANLAVLDMNAADGIQGEFDEISKWYIGGHSLGGSMAVCYLAEHVEEYEGLILLASYSTADLSDSGKSVLSIYGSEDQVLNSEKYQDNRQNFPGGMVEEIIEGGNHAYFGSYGEQEGDGEASISNEEQIEMAAELIGNFIE